MTSGQRVRVAIVDDSRSIRRWLRYVLESDARLEVVGEAGSSLEARELIKSTPVDVITLDVDMPGMTGIEFLARLMAARPMPVVMVSALTEQGSREAVEALSLGAVDCIEKPKTMLTDRMSAEICSRVWQAAQVRVAQNPRKIAAPGLAMPASVEKPWHGGIILLGASTGGVSSLENVFAELEGCDWPIVVAQHMPENFLRSFCRRLNEQFSRKFYIASEGHQLQSGQAVVALGKTVSTRLVVQRDGAIVCRIGPPSEDAVHKPSVDDLFQSASETRLNGVAALLTGMGSDGARGLRALREAGFYTVAQDEASCVVFGMPKAAIAMNAAVDVMSDVQIGKRFAEITKAGQRYAGGVTAC